MIFCERLHGSSSHGEVAMVKSWFNHGATMICHQGRPTCTLALRLTAVPSSKNHYRVIAIVVPWLMVWPWFVFHGIIISFIADFTAKKTMKVITPKPWLNYGRTTVIFRDIKSIIEPKSAFSLHINTAWALVQWISVSSSGRASDTRWHLFLIPCYCLLGTSRWDWKSDSPSTTRHLYTSLHTAWGIGNLRSPSNTLHLVQSARVSTLNRTSIHSAVSA